VLIFFLCHRLFLLLVGSTGQLKIARSARKLPVKGHLDL
jgi:hypothetical protein